MATRTGVELLSALRRSGSTSALREVPETFFVEDDERAAFVYLRDHVMQYRSFPDPMIFRRNTGITTLQVSQPLSYYMNEGRKRALYNALVQTFGDMRDSMESMDPDNVVAMARAMVSANSQLSSRGTDFVTLEAALREVAADFHEAHQSIGLRGIPSGWDYVDEQTGGFYNDDLISVVGRIGTGKTYILLFIAYSAWRAGYSVLFNTNELGVVQLARRLFGIHTRINPTLIRKGRLSTTIANSIDEQASTMAGGIPFNIVAGGFKKSVETVGAVAEATSPDLIVCDSSYLLEPIKRRKGSDSRYETVSDTVEDLKRLTIELRRPIIQSVQFNRSADRTGRPQTQQGQNVRVTPVSHLSLSKIADTDNIGKASSIVIGVAPAFAPYELTQRWLTFLKGREGESGTWIIEYRFSPVSFRILRSGAQLHEEGVATDRPDMSHMI